MRVRAVPADIDDPESIDLTDLAHWLTSAVDRTGREHAVLSDGLCRIRLDLDDGRLVGDGPVVLHYLFEGRRKAEQRVLPLRRLLHLFRHRRFSSALFPSDPFVARGIQLLQVHDAHCQGASHRDLAELIVGKDRTALDWRANSDSLRSRVRRLVHDARALAQGGYRLLLHRRR